MIGLKAIHQGSFVHKNTIFQHKARLFNKISTLCLCNSGGNSNPGGSMNPDGDTRKQELLARIVQIQTQKVRLTDFLDEKSTYLEQFAEEADAEFGKIGEDALKELDDASERIMESIKGKMQEFEERQEKNRLEMEENENKLADLEDQMIKDRNEGLFFQNLRPKTPMTNQEKVTAKEETQIIEEVMNDSAGSKIRRNIYLGLIGLLVISIGDSLLSSSADWRKVALLGAILVGLITQVVYEQSLSLSESKGTKKGEYDKNSK